MKLKKIASLALAGVMAVSMLAGCATKAPENGNGNTNTGSSVVDAVNDAQSAVTFTDNAVVDKALEKAVELSGEAVTVNDTATAFARLSGLNGYSAYNMSATLGAPNANNVYVDALGFLRSYAKKAASHTSSEVVAALLKDHNLKDGAEFTYVEVGTVNALNAEAAQKLIATKVEKMTEDLPTTTYEKDVTTAGEKYLNYSYAGNVSMTSATKLDTTTTYYYAIVMTQTVAVKDMPKV